MVLTLIEMKLALREFSGVLFGMIMPVGVMLLIGAVQQGETVPGSSITRLQITMPAVALIGVCAAGLMGIPLMIAGYREKKILKHFQVTPVHPLQLLLAQFLTNTVIALLSAAIVFITAALVFGYTMQGNPLLFTAAFLLIMGAIFSLGMMIAAVSRNVQTANLLASLLYFPMLFLSGVTVPFEILPAGVQQAASLLPLSQGVKLLKAVSTGNGFPAFPALVLAATAVAGTWISLKKFRWE